MSFQLSIFNDKELPENLEIFYVYILTNSITKEVIYVGKGKGNRMNEHLQEFHKISDNNPIEIDTFKEIKNPKKYLAYKKYKLFFEILKNGGQIDCRKIYDKLSEKEAYKIERLLIFILKRRVDYLFTAKIGRRRHTLKIFGGKLLNKAVGGTSSISGTIKYDSVDTKIIMDDFMSLKDKFTNNDFLNEIKIKEHPNQTDLHLYSSIHQYFENESKIIDQKINNFKKERSI